MLNRREAYLEMEQGNKVRSIRFKKHEYLERLDGVILNQDGENCTTFWNRQRDSKEWELYIDMDNCEFIFHFLDDSQDSYIKFNEDIPWSDFEEELKNKFNIIFNGNTAHPIKIIEREDCLTPLFIIGSEDDGHIWFNMYDGKNYINSFDSDWVDSLIKNLEIAQKHVATLKQEAYSTALGCISHAVDFYKK